MGITGNYCPVFLVTEESGAHTVLSLTLEHRFFYSQIFWICWTETMAHHKGANSRSGDCKGV